MPPLRLFFCLLCYVHLKQLLPGTPVFTPFGKLLLLKRMQSQRFKRVSWCLWLNSSLAAASLVLRFSMRVFTTKRPNAFKSFRMMLKAFKTEVDEGNKQTNKPHTTCIAIKAVPQWGEDKRKTKNVA